MKYNNYNNSNSPELDIGNKKIPKHTWTNSAFNSSLSSSESMLEKSALATASSSLPRSGSVSSRPLGKIDKT